MGNDPFEGYIGIRPESGQHVFDLLLIMILMVISVFAIVFRTYFPLMKKMLGGVLSGKERQNLFDTSMKENIFFKGFMKFQMLFLCTFFFFLLINNYAEIQIRSIRQTLLLMGLVFAIVYIFYFLKQLIYFLYGQAFSKNGRYKTWNSSYHTLSYAWGVLLYIPTLWLLFDKEHIVYPLILFLITYVLYRVMLIYTTIRIFYNKNTGFLFLSSYLCSQEFIPLFFLYEGLIYFHNIIDTSTLWH